MFSKTYFAEMYATNIAVQSRNSLFTKTTYHILGSMFRVHVLKPLVSIGSLKKKTRYYFRSFFLNKINVNNFQTNVKMQNIYVWS